MISRTVRTALISLSLFLILVIGGLLIASRLFNFILFAPRDLNLTVSAPQQTAPAASLPLQIIITNEGDMAQTVSQIEISKPYLKGVAILSSEPPYTSASSTRNWQIYGYDLSLPPGQSVTINLSAQAQAVGNYQGELDVCVNERRCRRVALVTRVEP